MEQEGDPHRHARGGAQDLGGPNGESNDTRREGRADRVAKLYGHLLPSCLDTLKSVVVALDVDERAWMDCSGRPVTSSDTASVLIVAPDNVRRCAHLVTQQTRNGGRLCLSVAGHWNGMISLFYETTGRATDGAPGCLPTTTTPQETGT